MQAAFPERLLATGSAMVCWRFFPRFYGITALCDANHYFHK
jgi:hypothetical protein